MKNQKIKSIFIFSMALMTTIILAGETYADDLLDSIDDLIALYSSTEQGHHVRFQHSKTRYDPIINEAANKNNLDPHLIKAIISVESNFDPRAVSSKGAEGLMQLIPSTGRELGVTDAFDARQNISAGAKYYKSMLEHFGNHRQALYAYNCGLVCVERGKIPKESKMYANNVIRIYKNLRRKENKNDE